MANRIMGITVEIGGDTTKLQTALKGVNGQIKSTQQQLKDVDKLLKLDPGNTELLAQKQKLLADAVGETKEKLATLKTAAEQANTALAIRLMCICIWKMVLERSSRAASLLQSVVRQWRQKKHGTESWSLRTELHILESAEV